MSEGSNVKGSLRSMALTVVGLALSAGWVVGSEAAAGEITPVPESFAALLEPVSEDVTVAPAPPEPQIVRTSARIQCVPYAREKSGVEIRGDAKTWWQQAKGVYERDTAPKVGSVIVMKGYNGADRGHVAVVRAVLSDRKIIVDHANWLNEGEITLNVPVKDVSKRGDWSQVRVWHIPGSEWGRRVYGALGFIAPTRITATRISAKMSMTPIS